MRDALPKGTLLKNMCRLLKSEIQPSALVWRLCFFLWFIFWCCQHLRLHLIKQKGDQWIINLKGFGEKWLWPVWSTIPAIFWEKWDNDKKRYLGWRMSLLTHEPWPYQSVVWYRYTNLPSEGCLIWVLRTTCYYWITIHRMWSFFSLTFTIWCESSVQYVWWK
jgi:hypothetical protein